MSTTKKTIFSFIFIMMVWAPSAQAVTSCKITPYQQSILNFSYSYGKSFDLGYTMVAIAMQESALGKYKINIQDPSAGVWHVTLDKGLKSKGWKDTPYNRNRIAQVMIDDIYFSAHLSIEVLKHFQRKHNGNWRKMVGSYNGGNTPNMDYTQKIINHINTIKRCGWVSSDL